ncbi:MAG: hypothetical protein K2I35_06835, partial [Duncaniella sp.]|nr:hypothetical protein [Duncaniella sp.]
MKKGSPVTIILLAIGIIIAISFLPLSKWSGGKVKDFSLFSDILKEAGIIEGSPSAESEDIDPELLLSRKHISEPTRNQTNSY